MQQLEGSLVRLEPVTVDDLAATVTAFQDAYYWRGILSRRPPTVERMGERLWVTLGLWRMTAKSGASSTQGYAGVCTHSGNPFLFVLPAQAVHEVEQTKDVVTLLLHAYFKVRPHLPEWVRPKPLMIYPERAVAEELRNFLLDCGFDEIEDYPVIDNATHAAFGIEPTTYQAYYGDESSP